MDEPGVIRPRQSRSWRKTVISGIAILVFGGVVWWFWSSSDGDLRAIMAAARSRHIATTSAEMGDVPSSPDRLAQWHRLTVLVKNFKSYSSLYYRDYQPLKLFEPIPAAMRSHHAAFDAAKMDDLLRLIDEIGAEPLILRTEYSHRGSWLDLQTQRTLADLLGERLALAAADQVEIEAGRLLKMCLVCDAKDFLSLIMKVSFTNIAWQGITRRLIDLRQHHGVIPDLIDRCNARLAADFKRGIEGEFVSALDCFGNPDASASRTLTSAGSFSPENSWESMVSGVDWGIGREPLLQLELDWVERTRTVNDPYALLQLAKACTSEYQGFQFGMLRKHMAGMVAPIYEIMVPSVFGTILRGRLLRAELVGDRWPTDDFDPTHAVLRSIVRDGTVCGAYSLNKSGDDLQGRNPNRYFPLYAPLDPPKPAAAPKP